MPLAFTLMNSFATSADTMAHLAAFPELATEETPLEFLQNMAPKVNAFDLSPATCATSPMHEWCPPGHGDVYPAMLGSGMLDHLLAKGASVANRIAPSAGRRSLHQLGSELVCRRLMALGA